MDPIVIESRVVAATVYGDLSQVSREGQTELAVGLSRFAWQDLPTDVDPADVRIETDRGRVVAVETELASAADPIAGDTVALDGLRADVYRLIATQEALRAELELLDTLVPGREVSSSPLRPDLFVQGLQALCARRRDALAALRQSTADHDEASRSLERAEAAGQDHGARRRQTLVVTVEASEPGPARLSITYASGWATWRPVYQLLLSPGGQRVELIRFGDVRQETGEAWTQVKLQLSTSEPERGLRLPTAAPWILQLSTSPDEDAQGPFRLSERKARVPAEAASAMTEDVVEEPVAEGKVGIATIEVTGDFEPPDDFEEYATQFGEDGVFAEGTSPGLSPASRADASATAPEGAPDPLSRSGARPTRRSPERLRLPREPAPREAAGGIDVLIDVPRAFDADSGPGRHRVQLGRRTYPIHLWYILRPGLRDHAFGRAEIINEDVDPILEGPASLFVGGAFHGHTRLATTPGNGKLTLDLGAETGIKSARRSDTHVRREGMLSKDEVHTVDVTIEIESFLAAAAQIQVQDQVPVATDAQVRVRLLSTEPNDAVLNDETGLVTFSTTIEPNTQRVLKLSYEVAAPTGYRLAQGLSDEVTQ